MDLEGQLSQTSEGYTRILTVVDRSIRRVEVLPPDVWIIRLETLPASLQTTEPNLRNSLGRPVPMSESSAQTVNSLPHRQSNEIVEQVHSQFTDDLRARDCGNKWSAHLSGLIAVPKEESGVLTAQLVRYMAAS